MGGRDVKFIAVKNFDAYQHYKNRVPPWIKLYNTLLDDYAFLQLSDASRSHLMLLWLVASRHKNRIPYDAKYIAGAIHARGKVDLAGLIASGFLSVVDGDASNVLAECEHPVSNLAIAEREREEERETEGEEEEHSRAHGGTREAEAAFRVAMGDHIGPVLDFLERRPAEHRANWFPELLRIIGPVTGVLPEDLAGGCSDALLVVPPAKTPVALRAFATRRKVERLKASIPEPAPRTTRITATASDDERLWSDLQSVVSKLRRRELPTDDFNALDYPLRAGLRAIGGWQAVNEAKPGSLHFLKRDFLAAYREAAATPVPA